MKKSSGEKPQSLPEETRALSHNPVTSKSLLLQKNTEPIRVYNKRIGVHNDFENVINSHPIK